MIIRMQTKLVSKWHISYSGKKKLLTHGELIILTAAAKSQDTYGRINSLLGSGEVLYGSFFPRYNRIPSWAWPLVAMATRTEQHSASQVYGTSDGISAVRTP